MPDLELNAIETAVIFIDLQRAIVGRQTAPHSSESVVQTAAELAARFREKGAMIVWVHVDLSHFVQVQADQPTRDPSAPPPPPDASELVPELNRQKSDLVITKRFWDAFWGTNLEKSLRDRKIKSIVLGGIATNFGVESTARSAAALGFNVVIVEDATTSINADAHQFAIKTIFPRLGRVRTSDQLKLIGR